MAGETVVTGEAAAHERVRQLARTLNGVSAEAGSNTPDFILGQFASSVLDAFDEAVRARDGWYGVQLAPGSPPQTGHAGGGTPLPSPWARDGGGAGLQQLGDALRELPPQEVWRRQPRQATETRTVFVDTETTSLRPDRRAWEIAVIVREPGDDIEFRWFVDVDDLDLGNADLVSLKIGGFYERHPQMRLDQEPADGSTVSEDSLMPCLESLLRGATIVGAVPSFDAELLDARMRFHGICPSWHYRLLDVSSFAAGALRMPPPWGFDDLLAAYGLTCPQGQRHTALGDAQMVRDLYDVVLGGRGAAGGS